MRHSILLLSLMLVLSATLVSCGGKNRGVGPKVEDHSQYNIESFFDVQADFGDSTVGTTLDTLRDMSDHPDDPGRYVLEEMIDYLPYPLDSLAEPLVDELGGEVNSLIVGNVPAVEEIQGVASGLSNAARVFEVHTFFDLGLDAAGRYTASHQLTSVHFSFMSHTLELSAAQLGDPVPTERIAVKLDEEGGMVIPIHKLPLPLGSTLQTALDQMVVPAVSEGVVGFDNLVVRWFACDAISATIADSIGGGEDTVMEACVSASSNVSDKLYEKLASLDQKGSLLLGGNANLDTDTSDWIGEGWGGYYNLGDGGQAILEPSECAFGMTSIPIEVDPPDEDAQSLDDVLDAQ